MEFISDSIMPYPGTPGKVAIVVDPIIGDKLRPHQVEGVQFMFDCVMV